MNIIKDSPCFIRTLSHTQDEVMIVALKAYGGSISALDLVLTSNSYYGQWLHKRQVKRLVDLYYCGRGGHMLVVIFF